MTSFIFALTLLSQIVLPPTLETIPIGAVLEWDHDGLDLQGNPELLDFFTVTVTDVGGTTVERSQNVGVAVPKQLPLDPFLAGLPVGDYEIRVIAVDTSGNTSDASLPLSRRWDRVSPTTPTNPRI